jgi:protein-S-isoprenylcysteine O-methyltransferase Ste14
MGPLAGPDLPEKLRSEIAVWIRGIAGVVFCALGAVWIAQGSGAMHGSGMSGHSSFALLGAVVVIIGLALLVWAARVRSRRANT